MAEEINFFSSNLMQTAKIASVVFIFQRLYCFAKKLRKQNVHHQDVSSILADDGGFWYSRSKCNQKLFDGTQCGFPFSAIKITENAYMRIYCFEQVELDTLAKGVCEVDVTSIN